MTDLSSATSRKARCDVDRCVAALGDAGVAGLVTATIENVTYLTGYTHWPLYRFREHGVYAVINRDGDRGLVAPLNAGEYLAVAALESCRVVTYGDFFVAGPSGDVTDDDRRWLTVRQDVPHCATAPEALNWLLRDLGLADGVPLSVDIPDGTAAALGSDLGQRRGDGGELLRRVRRIKTPAELDVLSDVARATERAMSRMFADLHEGVSEAHLAHRYRHHALDEAVDPGHAEINTGKRASGCFPPNETQRATPGDVVRADCGAWLQGYHSDTGRNAVLGSMPEKLHRAESALLEGIHAMLDHARAGIGVAALATLGIETVRTAGLPHYDRHHVGHGIGLEMYEHPILSPDAPPESVLREGEVLNLELPYYEIGVGGLQIEDTVHVTADGIKLITSANREVQVR